MYKYLLIIMVVFFTACSVKSYSMENNNIINKVYENQVNTISYDVEYLRNEGRDINGKLLLEDSIKSVFKEKNIKTSDLKNSNYNIEFKMNTESNDVLNFISGFISGYSLTLIPGYSSEDYKLNVKVKKEKKLLKTYEYSNGIEMYIWLPLVLFNTETKAQKVQTQIIDNMIKKLIFDMQKDGLLK